MKFKDFLNSKINGCEIISRDSLKRGVAIKRPNSFMEKIIFTLKQLKFKENLSSPKNHLNDLAFCSKIPNTNCSIYLSIYSDSIPIPGEKREKFILDILKMIANNHQFKYILMIDLGDQPFRPEFTNLMPKNLIKVISLNANVDDSKVISFPLGVSTFALEASNKSFSDILNEYGFREKSKLVCCGPYSTGRWSVAYPLDRMHRLNSRDRKRGTLLMHMSKKAWVDVQFDNMPLNKYYDYISKYKFVISPEGKGIDCHRTWEALYIKAVPVVEDSLHMRQFEDLPIIFVKDYNDLSADYLEKTYNTMLEKEYNFEKLKKQYWDKLIECEESSLK